jgi:hypothetical protein
MRTPRSAAVLISQVTERYKSAKAEPVGDPDGFGVQRTVEFSGAAGKFLAKTLPNIGDSRIVDVTEKGGKTRVTFSPRTVADQRHPFALDDAELVAESEDS